MGLVTASAHRLSGTFVHLRQACVGTSIGPDASHPERCLQRGQKPPRRNRDRCPDWRRFEPIGFIGPRAAADLS